jgi:RNA polymerase-binding transcription factor DksA
VTVDLETRRQELVGLRARITAAAEAVHQADEGGSELNSATGDQHIADHASDVLDREVDDTLEENAEHVAREIDIALARIDEGTYGRCAVCGAEIPEERLAAVPYATLCIEDRRKQEQA